MELKSSFPSWYLLASQLGLKDCSFMLGRDRSSVSSLGLHWYFYLRMIVITCYCSPHGSTHSTDSVSSLPTSGDESPRFSLSLPPPQCRDEECFITQSRKWNSDFLYGLHDTVKGRGNFLLFDTAKSPKSLLSLHWHRIKNNIGVPFYRVVQSRLSLY